MFFQKVTSGSFEKYSLCIPSEVYPAIRSKTQKFHLVLQKIHQGLLHKLLHRFILKSNQTILLIFLQFFFTTPLGILLEILAGMFHYCIFKVDISTTFCGNFSTDSCMNVLSNSSRNSSRISSRNLYTNNFRNLSDIYVFPQIFFLD